MHTHLHLHHFPGCHLVPCAPQQRVCVVAVCGCWWACAGVWCVSSATLRWRFSERRARTRTLQSCWTAWTAQGRRSQSLNTHTPNTIHCICSHFKHVTYKHTCDVLTASRLPSSGSFVTLHLSSSKTSSSSPACVDILFTLSPKQIELCSVSLVSCLCGPPVSSGWTAGFLSADKISLRELKHRGFVREHLQGFLLSLEKFNNPLRP